MFHWAEIIHFDIGIGMIARYVLPPFERCTQLQLSMHSNIGQLGLSAGHYLGIHRSTKMLVIDVKTCSFGHALGSLIVELIGKITHTK